MDSNLRVISAEMEASMAHTLVKELASAREELNHCENFVLINIFILRRKKSVL